MPLETDKQGGFKFALSDELHTGIWPNLFSRKVPLWSDGENVQFTQVGVEKIRGWVTLVDTSNGEPIRGLLQNLENSDEATIYAGDLTQLYRIDAGDSSIETLGTGYNLAEDSGATIWDTGSTTWDSDTTLWDAGVILADHWSMVNYGTFVLATSGADYPQIRKGYGDFVDMYQGVTGITVTTAGTGYTASDALTITGGDGSGATAKVLTVGGSGEILTVGMTDAGTNYTTAPTGFTGGTGSGAVFSFTVCDIDVTSVEVFVNRGPHILGFNTSNSSKEFVWCDADDVDTWVTDTDNLAGALQIRELKSGIVAAVPLGSRIAVYGADQMFLVSYLGNELVFGYQPAMDGIGAVSKHSVVAVGRKNYGLSSQGFFVTDGASYDYIDEPATRNYFKDNANQGQLVKAAGYHDEENNQVRWYFPTDSSANTKGVSYNYKSGEWSLLDGNRACGAERLLLSSPITGSETGIIYKEGVGANADGTAMTAWVRSKPMDAGNADLVKELDSIRLGFVGTGLQYRTGWSETEDGSINWNDYASMDEGFGFHNLRTAGRWLHFELYSDTLNAQWEVMSADFIGRMEGTR